MDCAVCDKWLRATDVMRAMHAPRSSASGSDRGRAPRPSPAKRAQVTWPPTAESRAAATPLPVRR